MRAALEEPERLLLRAGAVALEKELAQRLVVKLHAGAQPGAGGGFGVELHRGLAVEKKLHEAVAARLEGGQLHQSSASMSIAGAGDGLPLFFCVSEGGVCTGSTSIGRAGAACDGAFLL